MVKEITPVLFFGYDDRFIPDKPAEPVKHDTSGESQALQSIRRMDFRPQPIVTETKPEADKAEEQDEDPKDSPATDPAGSSSDGSQTSPSEGPAAPAPAEREQKDLTPPLL